MRKNRCECLIRSKPYFRYIIIGSTREEYTQSLRMSTLYTCATVLRGCSTDVKFFISQFCANVCRTTHNRPSKRNTCEVLNLRTHFVGMRKLVPLLGLKSMLDTDTSFSIDGNAAALTSRLDEVCKLISEPRC